jgi:hypothetical protein
VRLVFSLLIRDFDTCGSSELFGAIDLIPRFNSPFAKRARKNWA